MAYQEFDGELDTPAYTEFTGELDAKPSGGLLDTANEALDGALSYLPDSISNRVNALRGRAPAKEAAKPGTVAETITLPDPQLDPELNRQAMLKSGSPDSVMFKAGRAKQKADAMVERGAKLEQTAKEGGYDSVPDMLAGIDESKQRKAFADEHPVLGGMASSAANSLAGLANAPATAADFFNKVIVDPVLNAVGQDGMAPVPVAPGTQALKKYGADYSPTIASVPMEKAWDKGVFGEWMVAQLAQNSQSMVMSLASAMVPPLRAALLPSMGATSAGQSYADGDDSRVSVAKGMLEAGTEMLPLGIFDKLKELPLSASKTILADAGKRLLAAGGAITAQHLTEAIEEGVNQFAGNTLDKYVQGKDVGLMDDVAKSAVIGGVSGGALGVGHVVNTASHSTLANSQGKIADTEAAQALSQALADSDFIPKDFNSAKLNPNLSAEPAQRVDPTIRIAAAATPDEALAAFRESVAPTPQAPTEKPAIDSLGNPVPLAQSNNLLAMVEAEITAQEQSNGTEGNHSPEAGGGVADGGAVSGDGVAVGSGAQGELGADQRGAPSPDVVPAAGLPGRGNDGALNSPVSNGNIPASRGVFQTAKEAEVYIKANKLDGQAQVQDTGSGYAVRPNTWSPNGTARNVRDNEQLNGIAASQPTGQPADNAGVPVDGGESPVLARTNLPEVASFGSADEAVDSVSGKGLDGQVEIVKAGNRYLVAPKGSPLAQEQQAEDQRAIDRLNQGIAASGENAGVALYTPSATDSPAVRASASAIRRFGTIVNTAFGTRLIPVVGTNGYGVQFSGRAFIDVGSVGDNRNTGLSIPDLALHTVGHEVTHQLETSKDPQDRADHAALAAVIEQYRVPGALEARTKFEDETSIKFGGQARGEQYAANEIAADVNGAMWRDSKFWARLYEVDDGSTMRRIAYKFMQGITKLISVAKGRGNYDVSTWVSNVEAVREAAAQVWASKASRGKPQSRTAIKQELFETPPIHSRGVIAEVAPNPDTETGEQWRTMQADEKERATRGVANKTVQKVFDVLGLKGWSFNLSSGTYQGERNPNVLVEAPDSATPEQLDQVANALGYVYDQKAMVSYADDITEGEDLASFVKVIPPAKISTEQVNQLREWLAKQVPQVDADTLMGGKIVIGNFSAFNDDVETLSDEQFHQKIVDAVKSFDWDGGVIDIEGVQRYRSKLIWPDSRDDYLKGFQDGTSETDQIQPGDGRALLQGTPRSVLAQLTQMGQEAVDLRQQWIDASASGRQRAQERRGVAAQQGAGADRARVEYGTKTPGAVSAVGVHFSQAQRASLSSAYYGRGIKGFEGKRLAEPGNDDIRPRIFFYVDTGKGVTPEAGVGSFKHTVKLNNLYDASADPLGFIKNTKGGTAEERANKWERAIHQAGFDGYLANTGGQQDFAVLIGKHDVSMAEPKMSRRFRSVDEFEGHGTDQVDELGAFNLDASTEDANKEFDLTDEDMDAIQAELEATTIKTTPEPQKEVRDVTLDEMKAQGLFPEQAFDDVLGDAEERGSVLYFKNANSGRVAGSYYSIMKNGSSWDVDAQGTWASRVSKKTAIKFAKNLSLANTIHRSGYDLTSAYRKGTVLKLVEAWKKIAGKPGMFKITGKGSMSNVTFDELAKEMNALPDFDVAHNGSAVSFVRKSDGETFSASLYESRETLTACTMGLRNSGGLGSSFYSVAGEYARIKGLKFHADSLLSSINTARRTEQALSFSLKTGDSGVLLPGSQNRVYGFNENPKTQEDHAMNIGRLLLANLRNVVEIDPDIRRLRYHPGSDMFTDSKGANAKDIVDKFLSSAEARDFGVGRTTLARAVMTSNIISGNLSADDVHEFKAPIAYSRKAGFDEPLSEEWGEPGDLNPSLKRYMANSQIKHPDGTPIVMYHGTARDIESFRPKQAGAIFLTYRPEFANEFADFSAEWMSRHYDQVLTPEQVRAAKEQAVAKVKADSTLKLSVRKELAAQIMADKPAGEALDALMAETGAMMPSGPNIMPLVVNAENPFDFRNKQARNELVEQMFANAKDGTGATLKMWGDGSEALLFASRSSMSSTRGMLEVALEDGDWSLIEEPETQQALHDLGHDSFFVMEHGQLNLAVYSPTQIKSAVGNNGNYDGSDERIAYSRKDVEKVIRAGAYSTAALRIQRFPHQVSSLNVNDVGELFDAAHAKEFGGAGDWNKPADFKRAVRQAVAEVKHQLAMEKSGLDWYEEDIRKAFNVTIGHIPSLADPTKQVLFSVMAGIMSPKTIARDNWSIAAEAFQYYDRNGRIPERNPKNGKMWQGGLVSAQKTKNLSILDAMVRDMTEQGVVDWLSDTHTIREINDMRAKYGSGPIGENGKATDTRLGYSMFGPKVGPFVSNINGIHDVTVDVWMTRSFSRYFGTMMSPDGQMIEAPTEDMRAAAKALAVDVGAATKIKPYQVQSVLWFFEQGLFNKLGTGAKSYGFSDGAEKFSQLAGAGKAEGAGDGRGGVEDEAGAQYGEAGAGDRIARQADAGDRETTSYARRAGPVEQKYQHNYLVPEVEGFTDDGNIAVLPALVFARDGITRTFPKLPVRMRVGEHQRVKTGDFVKQYGLQHRIENAKENPKDRGYVTPNTGDEVERAARDITLGVLDAQTAYADSSPTKVYLHAPTLNRSTVLETQTDAKGEKFWSVVTSMPSTREQMMRRYKAPTSVVGTTLNGERTQQAFDIKRGILEKLKEPGQSPVTAESYIIDKDGLLFKGGSTQPVNSVPVVVKKKRVPVMPPKFSRNDAAGPGFYSALARSIGEIDAKAMTPAMWKDRIQGLLNKGAIKSDEVEWTGLNDWLGLQEGRVTKEQITGYLDANGVKIEEVSLGQPAQVFDVYRRMYGRRGAFQMSFGTEDDAQDWIDENYDRNDDSDEGFMIEESEDENDVTGLKYKGYSLPGGQNYREVLLTLPDTNEAARTKRFGEIADEMNVTKDRGRYEELRDERTALAEKKSTQQYQSSHWDQTGVLAHVRVTDRTDSTGAKILFVEEIQSDFGQAFKKQRDAISKAVDNDFEGIIARMKKAGVLEVNCD